MLDWASIFPRLMILITRKLLALIRLSGAFSSLSNTPKRDEEQNENKEKVENGKQIVSKGERDIVTKDEEKFI